MFQEEYIITHEDVEGAMCSLPHGETIRLIENLQFEGVGHATADFADLSKEIFSFQRGHFPGHEIVPGYLIAEALGQLTGVAMYPERLTEDTRMGVLRKGSIEMLSPVYPGEKLNLEVVITRNRFGFLHSDGYAYKNGNVVAYSQTVLAFVDPNKFKP